MRAASRPAVARQFARCFSAAAEETLKTSLYDLHVALGGKPVPFAGYWLPVEYPGDGCVLKSHHWTRKNASLFDVSHMGQVRFFGDQRIKFFESITVADVQALKPNQARLSSIPNETGGLIDDCIVTRRSDHLFLVINAACKHKDLKHIKAKLEEFNAKGGDVQMEIVQDRSLVALQGPKAAFVLQKHVPVDLKKQPFLFACDTEVAGIPCQVSRCGYTGEDGFEISVPHARAREMSELFLSSPEVHPCGLGARDSLRLEAGMCLYGHELDETITPIEADLMWTITKRRRAQGGFPGYAKMKEQMEKGVTRKRIGLFVDGAPAREHTELRSVDGKKIGEVTSGTFSPVLKRPISIGYLPPAFAKVGTVVHAIVRGKPQKATVTKMPFVPTSYYKPQ